MKTKAAWHFTCFRILFGAYLAFHFAALAPYAQELFGAEGIMKNPALNPTHGLFPNPLSLDLPGWAVTGSLLGLCLCSILFLTGVWRQGVAVFLWFGWTALFHRNNLIANPSIPYVGLLLVLSALVPSGEPLSLGKPRCAWEMPVWIPRCAWILLAVGYAFSGITKLVSPSWIDGSAIGYLMENPLSRPGVIRDLMLQLPNGFIQALTWGTLFIELAFLPLAIWKKSRPFVWLAMVCLHLGIMLAVDFADLSMGMLMIHFFTFDPKWLGAVKRSFARCCLIIQRKQAAASPCLSVE
ncbi:MAG: HTTM domain-containing protein [Luteolibacter sp.]